MVAPDQGAPGAKRAGVVPPRNVRRRAGTTAVLGLVFGMGTAAGVPGLVDEEPRPASPEALAATVMELLVSGDPEAFDRIFPSEEGRSFVRSAREQDIPLVPGGSRVLRSSAGEATLLLAAHPALGNSGDETIYSRLFSGLYRAVLDDRGWRISHRVPMDGENRITRQMLHVELDPGHGLWIHDTLEVEVGSREGFWAHLNHRAQLESVSLEGSEVDHHFQSGLLWAAVPPGAGRRLELKYRLDVAADSAAGPNSGRFEVDFGHVRSQYFWHPFFDFHTAADRAYFRIRVEAPADVEVLTSLPQTDFVQSGRRIVEASSEHPVSALTLLYDREWERHVRQAEEMRIEVFTVPGFRPGAEEIASDAEEAYRILRAHFGEPGSRYLAIAQGRARPGGWHFRSNDLVVGGGAGAAGSRGGALPRAWLGHEVAHGWTRPSGDGSNFLSEGWAMLAEALLIEARYGSELLEGYWEHHRNVYERRGWDGRASLLGDPNNAGIAYYKGSWVLRMLRDVMGEAAFDAGLGAYMALLPGSPAGVEEFVEAMSGAAGWDVWAFLRPWLEESRIPHLRVSIEADGVAIDQLGPSFAFPLELDLVTEHGTVRRTVQLGADRTLVPTRELGPISDVLVDPDRRMLMRRDRGEIVTFRLEAPEAGTVHLLGDFSEQAFAATRDGDLWSVSLSLSAGRYAFWWGVDGALGFREPLEVVHVKPLIELPDALPH
jgi:hypothetical protein